MSAQMNEERRGATAGVDGLLTIGGSYRWFDCKKSKNCAVPFTPLGDDHCFVHESEWRGVSRKVGLVPRWVIPGTTRIFLAWGGRGSFREKTRIYGYFVLQRVEVLSASPSAAHLCIQSTKKGLTKSKVSVLEGVLYDSDSGRRLGNGIAIAKLSEPGKNRHAAKNGIANGRYRLVILPGGYSLEVSAEGYKTNTNSLIHLKAGDHRSQDLFMVPLKSKKPTPKVKTDEGSGQITHVNVDGKWVPTGEKRDKTGKRKRNDGDIKWNTCWNGSIIITHVRDRGNWVPTGAECPTEIPIDDERFSVHRSCSLRYRPQAIYLVDALAAEIADAFSSALKKKAISTAYQEASSDGVQRKEIKEGNDLFEITVKNVRSRMPRLANVPRKLSGRVYCRSALVLFKKPPLLISERSHTFRSLAHIDGDDVVNQVADGAESVEIIFTKPGLEDFRTG